jgi:nucleoside-diphosphate-sugar epimerase
MNILVIGANSFVGQNLIHKLIEQKFRILGTSRTKSLVKSPYYDHIIWDSSDPNLPAIGVKIDAIIILSTVANINYNQNILSANIKIITNAVKLIKLHGIKKVIFTSSMATYNAHKELIKIDEATIPWSFEEYGLSKIVSEKLLKELDINELSIIRLPGIIGPKAIHSFIPSTLKKLKSNEEVIISNPNSLFNHILAVSDLSVLILKILLLNNVNIEAPVGVFPDTTLMEIVNVLKTATNSKSKISISEPIMPSSIILSQVWTQLDLEQPKCSQTIKDFAMNY